MSKFNVSNAVEVLRYKKNIILQGAPGVGKTYNTAMVALGICGVDNVNFDNHAEVMAKYKELRESGQIEFVTFHQSMDYEDFIEGIKPELNKNGSVSYEVKDGIFKRICKRALSPKLQENNVSYDNMSTEEMHNIFSKKHNAFEIDKILSNEDKKEIDLNGIVYVEYNENGNPIWNFFNENGMHQGFAYKKGLDNWIGVLDCLDAIIKNGFSNAKQQYNNKYHNQYIMAYIIYKFFENNNCLKNETENYVLIIDEINRGNVSKIFGELITLLESDKRLETDHEIKLTLPYSKKEFGIPDNLYIIGTMNTTDRSVGNIDYAVRRRFAFVTLPADESVLEKYSKGKELFKAVSEFIEKNNSNDIEFDDLMVGHSYFMADDENELRLKLKYEILPLLEEYYKDGILKEKPKADEFFEILN